jgi:hypothetical protein
MEPVGATYLQRRLNAVRAILPKGTRVSTLQYRKPDDVHGVMRRGRVRVGGVDAAAGSLESTATQSAAALPPCWCGHLELRCHDGSCGGQLILAGHRLRRTPSLAD